MVAVPASCRHCYRHCLPRHVWRQLKGDNMTNNNPERAWMAAIVCVVLYFALFATAFIEVAIVFGVGFGYATPDRVLLVTSVVLLGGAAGCCLAAVKEGFKDPLFAWSAAAYLVVTMIAFIATTSLPFLLPFAFVANAFVWGAFFIGMASVWKVVLKWICRKLSVPV